MKGTQAAFETAWRHLAENGYLDELGSKEYQRLHTRWIELGRPAECHTFLATMAGIRELGVPPIDEPGEGHADNAPFAAIIETPPEPTRDQRAPTYDVFYRYGSGTGWVSIGTWLTWKNAKSRRKYALQSRAGCYVAIMPSGCLPGPLASPAERSPGDDALTGG